MIKNVKNLFSCLSINLVIILSIFAYAKNGSGGVEALLATSCTTSSCGTPEASICAFAELQFPDLSLPSYELCGNEIGFNFDLGSVGAEVCWDV